MEKFDVLSYLDFKGISYSFAGKNVSKGWIGIKCPSCSDHSNHFGINLSAKTYSCFKCGEKGNGLKLIQLIERCQKKDALKVLRKFSDSNFIYVPEKRVVASTITNPKGMTKKFDTIFTEFLLERRFMPDEVINKYDLYSGSYLGDFPLRIVIPVYLDNEIVTFQARDVTGKSQEPYRAYPIEKSLLPIKSTLYNIDRVRDKIVIVEGVLDAWRIGDGAVATFGTAFTDEQIRMLMKKAGKMFVMYDAEEDAQKQAKILGSILKSLGKDVEILTLDSGDPADMTEDEVKELRRDLRL